MTLLLAGTHMVAFLLGALVCYRVVLWYGRRIDIHFSEDDMAEPAPETTPRRFPTFLILVIVALFVIVVIGGLQARQWQQDAADSADKLATAVDASDLQRGCLNRWAKNIGDTITARSDSNTDLRAAEKAKDEADDAVTDVFVAAFLTDPPPPDADLEEQFTDALNHYVHAKAHLAEVRAEVESTTAENPYPELDLHCDNPLDPK